MSSYIFYGSKVEFQKKIPKHYRTLTDLVMELDVSKMLVQIEGQEHKENSVEKVKVEDFVAGSQEYAGVTEQTIAALNDFDFNKNSNYKLQNLMMISRVVDVGYFSKRAQELNQELDNKIEKSIIKYGVSQ